MLYETNYYSTMQQSTELISDTTKPMEHSLKKCKKNSKLQSILNSIQRDQFEDDSKEFMSPSSCSSSFSSDSTSSSSPFIEQYQQQTSQDDSHRNDYIATGSTNGLIIDPSMNEHKHQYGNYFQYSTTDLAEQSYYPMYQQNEQADSTYYSNSSQNDTNVQTATNETNFYSSFSPIISSLQNINQQSYNYYTTNAFNQQTVIQQQQQQPIDYVCNQQEVTGSNQQYYLMNQTNSNNYNYDANQYQKQYQTEYYNNQSQSHLSHQLSYSNETNSLIFNIESNHSTADLDESSLSDTDDDDDLDDSNDDLGLSYKMEVNNFMLLNQQIDNKKGKGLKKSYQKKKKDLQQQFNGNQAFSNNSSMTSNSNTNKRKRKRILNRLQRAEATMREKRRMLKLNKAFEELRKVLPLTDFAKNKLSRAETLKSAIEHIEKLSDILSI